MKPDEEVIAKAVRVEEDSNGDVFLTFKVMDAKWKQRILREWYKDLEFFIDGKFIKPSK